MKKLFPLLLLFATFAGLGTTVRPALADLPPIIDRQLLFGDPEIAGAQLSPDGKWMSFLKPNKNVRNVWVKKLEEPFSVARPITADPQPVLVYFWSRDGKYVLYAQDKGGNENFHVYAVDPSATADAASGVPPARDLTPIDGVRALIFAVPEEQPDVMIVGLNDRDKAYHDVYKVKISTGEKELLIKNTEKVGFWLFDRSGNVRLGFRQTDDGGNEILRVDGQTLTSIYKTSYLEAAAPVGFSVDQKKIYLATNKGDDVDLSRLEMLDPATGKTEVIESDPDKQVDFEGAEFDDQTHELMATYYVGDRLRLYPKTKRCKEDLERARKKLPDGDLSIGSSTHDMRYSLVSVSSDLEPGSTYLYDRQKGSFTLQYRVREKLPRESLAPMKAIRYTARDGMTIPAYLTLPKGVPAKNLPVIIHPHGGPWARDNWGYSPFPQFLANRGYVVLQPNFRSSTGYGKKFLNAGNKQWGTGAMQNDLSDAVKYLIDQGIADPKKVAIFGGSYGGYATLAGVAYTPDLYSCGVPYCAPSSLITLMESFPAYWRPFLKGSWYMRVGDPANEADRKDLEARSPINSIDKIHVPLLVVHGQNDPRVKRAESDRIVMALRDRGQDVEYLVAPDEGHGFRTPENRMALAVALERFFAKHLGGRAQQDVPADLAANLSKITVDPKSLVAAGAVDAALLARAKTGPLPTADGSAVQAGVLEYAATLDMQGKPMEIAVTRTIEPSKRGDRACWRVTEATQLPMVTMTSTLDVDKKSLDPVHFETAGMATMKLDFTPTTVTGEMGMAGQTSPVDVKLDAPVLMSGASLEMVLSGLPLADGYSTTLRTFEGSKQVVRPMKLAVVGSESATVTAGTFDTYIVSLEPLDGDDTGTMKMNVTKSLPHRTVKSTTKLPAQMGGGNLNSQLKSVTSADKASSEKVGAR